MTREHSKKLLPVWKQELAKLESGGWRGSGVKVCVAGLEAGIREGNIKLSCCPQARRQVSILSWNKN